MGETGRVIVGEAFLDWLKQVGIVPDLAYRVIVDAQVGEPVRVYAYRFGTEDLVALEPPRDLKEATLFALLGGHDKAIAVGEEQADEP